MSEAEIVPGASNDASSEAVWLKLPSCPPIPRDEVIWHYTTADGLMGILKSNCLWASSASMLNDSSEILFGLDAAKTGLDEFRQHASLHPTQDAFILDVWDRVNKSLEENEVFVLCATRYGDDLGQWRGYSTGSGYAVGLEAKTLATVHEGGAAPQWKPPMILPSWEEVVYDPAKQRELIKEAWEFASIVPPPAGSDSSHPHWNGAIDNVEMVLLGIVSRLKHPAFQAEREVRCVIDGRDAGLDVSFRAGSQGITPYVQLAVPAQKNPTELDAQISDPGTLPIRSVRVGPAQDQLTAARGVRALLDSTGHNEASVDRSEIPFR